MQGVLEGIVPSLFGKYPRENLRMAVFVACNDMKNHLCVLVNVAYFQCHDHAVFLTLTDPNLAEDSLIGQSMQVDGAL